MPLRQLDASASVVCSKVKENTSEEKPLRTTSFIVHATRGVIRDQNTRRKTMFVLLVIAFLLLLSGSTFLQSMLNPREHLVLSLLFWFTCLWLTLTALLLAVFDLLMVRLEARRTQRSLRERFTQTPDSPSRRDDE